MALYSMFVECEGLDSFSTQMVADTPPSAVRRFLGTTILQKYLEQKEGWPTDLSSDDIFMFMPMEGLTNMYLCQLGRSGKYVSIVLARTVTRPEPNTVLRGFRNSGAEKR